jgi:hypothetical protein
VGNGQGPAAPATQLKMLWPACATAGAPPPRPQALRELAALQHDAAAGPAACAAMLAAHEGARHVDGAAVAALRSQLDVGSGAGTRLGWAHGARAQSGRCARARPCATAPNADRPPPSPRARSPQLEERAASGEAALQLAAQLVQDGCLEPARALLERCLREQLGAGGPGAAAAAQAALQPRTRVALGWAVLQQHAAAAGAGEEADNAEVAAAAQLFEAAIEQDPNNLEAGGRSGSIAQGFRD